MRLSESAEGGCALLRRRHTLAIHDSQSRCALLSLSILSSAQRMLSVQRHRGARGEWFSRQQFIGRMHFDARLITTIILVLFFTPKEVACDEKAAGLGLPAAG